MKKIGQKTRNRRAKIRYSVAGMIIGLGLLGFSTSTSGVVSADSVSTDTTSSVFMMFLGVVGIISLVVGLLNLLMVVVSSDDKS